MCTQLMLFFDISQAPMWCPGTCPKEEGKSVIPNTSRSPQQVHTTWAQGGVPGTSSHSRTSGSMPPGRGSCLLEPLCGQQQMVSWPSSPVERMLDWVLGPPWLSPHGAQALAAPACLSACCGAPGLDPAGSPPGGGGGVVRSTAPSCDGPPVRNDNSITTGRQSLPVWFPGTH